MNIAIYGFGSIGRYYLSLLDIKAFKNIFIIDKKFPKTKKNKNIYYLNNNNFIKKSTYVKFAIICTPSNLHYLNAKFFLEKKNKCFN